MDITFNCNKCGQNVEIDEAGAGQIVDCPKCKTPLEVPSKRNPEKSRYHPAPQPAKSVEIEIKRRSGWASFLNIFGALSLCVSIGGCVLGERQAVEIFIIGVLVGIQSLFFGFLVDVFTDIRWFLKQLVEKK